MWYLLLVITIEFSGLDGTYLLKPQGQDGFDTEKACLEAKAKVQQGMAEAYPEEGAVYRLKCYNPEEKEA